MRSYGWNAEKILLKLFFYKNWKTDALFGIVLISSYYSFPSIYFRLKAVWSVILGAGKLFQYMRQLFQIEFCHQRLKLIFLDKKNVLKDIRKRSKQTNFSLFTLRIITCYKFLQLSLLKKSLLVLMFWLEGHRQMLFLFNQNNCFVLITISMTRWQGQKKQKLCDGSSQQIPCSLCLSIYYALMPKNQKYENVRISDINRNEKTEE
jgi:hypothetical protein